ncbi:MAG: hypothetical protein PUC32_03575 [Oscillospiraceae bacterium]|nr:hypothetical protein [Oscillospiraceae bacterium]
MKRKRNQSPQEQLRQGFEQLAFGSVTDAVRLLFAEDLSELPLEKMELFNVSEIKRLKGGGMEIKFADRLKALQCLEELELSQQDGDSDAFYRALEKSAALLGKEEP